MEPAAPHTPGEEAPSTRERSPGRNPSWLLSTTRLHRNPSWNLPNQNGQASVPGGWGRASAPNKEPETGEWLSDRYGSGESEKGKGLSAVCRLDCAQGLGPRRRRQNTSCSLERGQGPTWPPTHQSLARLAVQPQPQAAQGGRSRPSVWPSSGFPQHPHVPPPTGTSHSTGANPNSSSSSSPSPAKPSPLLFTRRTWEQVAET